MEKKHQIIRFVIYILILLPLTLQRDLTPGNELKYLSIADESIADGHFFTMYNHQEPYADKPPLYCWILMGINLLFGSHIPALAILLFSIIPALVILFIFNRWTEKELPEKWRIAAELALLTSVYFLGGALVLRMDMLMCMFITLAMYTFYRMYEGDTSLKLRLLFPIYIFMALFSKGPVGIMVPLFCIPVFLAVKKQFKTIGRYWGWLTWLILAVLCGIWFTCAYLEGGTPYINNLLFHQTIDRAINAEVHNKGFFFYFYSIFYAAAPWAFITIGTVIWAAVKKKTISALSEFMLIVAATIFVMLTIVSSKLEIYLLPSFGFLTYGAFMILAKYQKDSYRRAAIYGSTAILLLVFAAGFVIRNYNSKIGCCEVAMQAKAVAKNLSIERFGYCGIKGGANIDVFLDKQLEHITYEQLQDPDRIISDSNGIIIFVKRDGSYIFYTFAPQTSQQCITPYQVLN